MAQDWRDLVQRYGGTVGQDSGSLVQQFGGVVEPATFDQEFGTPRVPVQPAPVVPEPPSTLGTMARTYGGRLLSGLDAFTRGQIGTAEQVIGETVRGGDTSLSVEDFGRLTKIKESGRPVVTGPTFIGARTPTLRERAGKAIADRGEAISASVRAFDERMAPPAEVRRSVWENPDLLTNPVWWASMAGSGTAAVVGFAAPAAGAAKGSSFIANLATWGRAGQNVTRAAGLTGATVFEATAEASFAYQQARDQGMSHEQAGDAAAAVAKENLLLIGATGGVAYAAPAAISRAGRLGQATLAAGMESGQEVGQEMIAARNLGIPSEGKAEAGILGFLIGPLQRLVGAPFTRQRRMGRAQEPDVDTSQPMTTPAPVTAPADALIALLKKHEGVLVSEQPTVDLAPIIAEHGGTIETQSALPGAPEIQAATEKTAEVASAPFSLTPEVDQGVKAVDTDLLAAPVTEDAPAAPVEPVAPVAQELVPSGVDTVTAIQNERAQPVPKRLTPAEPVATQGPSGDPVWKINLAQYKARKGVHTPHIGEISQTQIARMSKRARTAYEKKRGKEWGASAQAATDYGAEIGAAFDAGTITLETKGLTTDAESAIRRHVKARHDAADEARKTQALDENRITDMAQVEVGDSVFDIGSGRQYTVRRKFKKSVGLSREGGPPVTRQVKSLQWHSYNDVIERYQNARSIAPERRPVTLPKKTKPTRKARAEKKSEPNGERAPEVMAADVTNREADELARILAEMDTAPFQPTTATETTRRGGDLEWQAGAAGAPVYNDIVGTGFTHLKRGDLIGKLGNFIRTGERSVASDLVVAVARRRIAGDKSLSKPILPPEAGSSPVGASVGVFADQAEAMPAPIPDVPATLFNPGRATREASPVEFPELVDLARELQHVPQARRMSAEIKGKFRGDRGIALNADLFKQGNEQQLAKTLAHEIGHLVDWLPDRLLTRGNILGSLQSLHKFLKGTYTAKNQETIKNKAVREELKALSAAWRPWDRSDAMASTIRYRDSARELYADAISALLTNPAQLKEQAPTFYLEFFAELDRKPDVERAYFDLHELLAGTRPELVARRIGGDRRMFHEGDVKAVELEERRQAERKESGRNLWFQLKNDLLDKNYAVSDRIKEMEKKGIRIPEHDDPRYMLAERNYLGGKIEGFVRGEVQPVHTRVVKAGIDWHDFGLALFYERIIDGDRSDLANPRGVSPADAGERYAALRAEWTPKQIRALERGMHDFRAAMRAIADQAYTAGLYTPEMYKQMEDNPAYVTFKVIDHLEDAVTSRIYQQIGTLKDITNPANATILKAVVTLRAAELNTMKKATFKALADHPALEIKNAKTVWSGKGHRPIESKDSKEHLVTYYERGHLKGKYVDRWIADSLTNHSVGHNNAVVRVLRLINSHYFRPVYTTLNTGFQLFNIWRDFGRYFKALSQKGDNVSFGRAVRQYWHALPMAKVRAFGLKEKPSASDRQAWDDLIESQRAGILSMTFNDFVMGHDVEETEIQDIMRRSGFLSEDVSSRTRALKPFLAVIDALKTAGDYIETIPKAAGIYHFKGDGPISAIGPRQRDFIRKNLGSPDFLAGGTWKPVSNNLLLFSNAILQAWRSDLRVATDPETRSGYWWKTVELNLLPKVAMAAALAGLWPDNEDGEDEVQQVMQGASEYDRTNYIIVPLGKDAQGNGVYFRMPQDDSGRFVGGLFWKALQLARGEPDTIKTLQQVVDYTAGQVPSVAPIFDVAGETLEFAIGRNPYDAFRGRTLFTDDELKAPRLALGQEVPRPRVPATRWRNCLEILSRRTPTAGTDHGAEDPEPADRLERRRPVHQGDKLRRARSVTSRAGGCRTRGSAAAA